ncbi:carboxypeptidase regulatory-like domain-containing protein [Spirosoma aerophilum]
MKSFVSWTILLLSLFAFWGCNEDTYVDPIQLSTIRGRVLYSVNQRPIGNATVTLSPTSRVVTTDSLGNFRFDSVLVDSYTLRVSKVGYGTESSAITVSADASPIVTVLLTDDQTQNRPPTAPTLVSPATSSRIQSTSLTLKWTATDPNRDSLTYNVLLFKSGSATPTSSYTGLTADSLVVTNLDYNTTYLWQVVVSDKVNTVNGPVWSFTTGAVPDYSFVFARRINGQYQIFAANTTGPPVQLTTTGSNWRPVVSPNKQQIAFISNATTEPQLFLMNANGSNIRQVTNVPITGLYPTDLSFCWSPDGTQLLYPSNDRLYAVRIDGTGLREVAKAPSGRVFADCDWTPQGNRIAARTTGTSIYDNEIMVLQNDGANVRTVYSRRENRVGNPAFSVDGRQLVFSADASGFMNEQGRQLDARLYLLDLATNGVTDLSAAQTSSGNSTQTNKPAGTNDIEPRFSPNGAQIIFTNVDNTGSTPGSVYTLDLTGTSQPTQNRKLLFTSAEMPYWRQ